MKSLKMLAIATSVLGAVPAFAQEAAPAPAPAPDATATQDTAVPAAAPQDAAATSGNGYADGGIDPTFTGPRIEGFGGANFQKYKFRPLPAGADNDHTGGVAGVLAGYDLGFRNFVVGAFGSYALITSGFCDTGSTGSTGRCVRPDREIEGGARIGFKAGNSFLGMGNRLMIYGKGAYVNTSVKVQSRYTDGGVFNTHRNIDGWRAGAGLEYAVNEHAYVKVEYDYTRTNRFSLAPYGFANTDYRMDSNRVIGGFGIRF